MTASTQIGLQDYARDGFRFFTPTPTRWGDCDMFGHVNNVQFVRYYESGRLDYFRLIIADIHVTFLRQIHHPCALEVGSRISRLGNKSFDFAAAIFAPGEDQPCSTAKAACVWFNYRDNHSTPIPPTEREIIEQFEGIES
jgi:acyl-CoA thioester hydrolase